MKNIFKSKKVVFSILSIIILVASIIAGLYLTKNIQRTKVKADNVELKIVGPDTSLSIGDTFQADVFIDTKGLNVTAADIKINFDPTKLESINIQKGDFLPTIIRDGQVVQNIASIVLGCEINEQSVTPKSGAGIIARLNFRTLQSGSTNIIFDDSTAVAAIGYESSVLNIKQSLIVQVNEPATATPSLIPTSIPTDATLTPTPTPTQSGQAATSSPTTAPTGTPTDSPIPTDSPTQPPQGTKHGDINNDNVVNIIDIGIIIDNYAKVPIENIRADVNNDNVVNIIDIGIVIDNYEK